MTAQTYPARNALVDAYEVECRQRRASTNSKFMEVLSKGSSTFTLLGQPVADKDMEAMASMLRFSNVSELVLKEIRLSSQTWVSVLKKCSKTPLKVVLAGCKLGECSQVDIARACGELQASHLDLSSTDISDDFVTTLSSTPLLAPGSPCHTINLSNNRITDTSVFTLAQQLQKVGSQCTLRCLVLAYNCITDVGAMALADVIGGNSQRDVRDQPCLEHLDLEGNHVGDEGAVAIAASVQRSKTLVSLRFSYNSMESVAMSYWSCALQNNSLEALELASSFPKPGGGITKVLQAAAKSARLRLLDVRGAVLEGEAVDMACQLMSSACPLEVLRLTVADAEGGHRITQAIELRGTALDVTMTGPVDQTVPPDTLVTNTGSRSAASGASAAAHEHLPGNVSLQADMLRIKLARFGGGSARGTPLGSGSRGGTAFEVALESHDTTVSFDGGSRGMAAWRLPSEHTTEEVEGIYEARPARAKSAGNGNVHGNVDPSDCIDDASEAGTEVSAWGPPLGSSKAPNGLGNAVAVRNSSSSACDQPLGANAANVKALAPTSKAPAQMLANGNAPAWMLEGGLRSSYAGVQSSRAGLHVTSHDWSSVSIADSDRVPALQRRRTLQRCRSAETPPVAARHSDQASLPEDGPLELGSSVTPSLKPRLLCTRPRAFVLGGADDPARPGRLTGLSSGGSAERAALAFLKADEECKGRITQQQVARALQELGLFEGLKATQLGKVMEKDAKLSNPTNDGTFTFPEFLACFERLERWHAQQLRQGRILAHSGQPEVPAGWADNTTLRKSFRNFCTYGKSRAEKAVVQHADLRLSSQQWAKLCRDAGLLEPEGPLPVFALDIIFATCKPPSQRHLHYNTFLSALAMVAKEAGMTFEEVAAKLGCRQGRLKSAPSLNARPPNAGSCATSVCSDSVLCQDEVEHFGGGEGGGAAAGLGGGDALVTMRAVEHVLRVVGPREAAVADRLQRIEEMLVRDKENDAPAFKAQQGQPSISKAVRAEVRAMQQELTESFQHMLRQLAPQSASTGDSHAVCAAEIKELREQLRAQNQAIAELQKRSADSAADAQSASKTVRVLKDRLNSLPSSSGDEAAKRVERKCMERQSRLEGAIMQVASRVDMLDESMKQNANAR